MSDFEISEEAAGQSGDKDSTGEFLGKENAEGLTAHSGNSQCMTLKPDGGRCQARPLYGKPYCYFHDPALTEHRMAASSRGGARKQRPPAPLSQDVLDLPLKNRADAVSLLERTVNQVLRGTIDPKIANSVGFLVGMTSKLMDTGLLEERLAMLEALVEQTPKRIL